MRKVEPSAIALWVIASLIAMFLILPTLIIVPISFTTLQTLNFPPVGFTMRWYQAVFNNPEWRNALVNSLIVASVATTLSTVFGTMAAIGISRLSRLATWATLPILLAPLVTPVVVLAVGIYMTFSRWGLSNSLLGLIIAHTMLATPFVIVSVMAGLRSINRNLELASEGLGATPFFTFRRVLLPLIAPGVVSGAIFAFITSWDEVVVALLLTSGSTQTIPVLIWSQVRADLYPSMAAVGTMLITVSALVLLVSQKLMPLDQK